MKSRFILYLLTLLTLNSFAWHNKGGVITWQYMGGFSYKVRITTLTENASPPGNLDRCKLTLQINHADSIVLPRINGPLSTTGGDCSATHDGVDISSDRHLNIYEGTYMFPCEGIFTLSTFDSNRNAGILNVPNSVNTQIYFESQIVVPKSSYQCSRNSFDLQLKAYQINNFGNEKFYPLTFNPNGDSLVYSLIPCQYNNGQNIPGYSSTGFSVNAGSGELTWNNTLLGDYSLCIKMKAYRNQEYIGSINYDFPARVVASSNYVIFSGFTSNLTPVNGVYQLNPSQTFTLSGTNAANNSLYFNLTSEITGSTTSIVNPSTFSLSITHSVSAARNEPYKLYISTVCFSGIAKDTLIRIKMLGTASNTCGIMGITTTTCFVSVKENKFDRFEFRIYPSITSNELNLKGNYKKLAVMDVSGKLLEPLMLNNSLMNVENFAPGVYILSVTDTNNHNHYYKFVKR